MSNDEFEKRKTIKFVRPVLEDDPRDADTGTLDEEETGEFSPPAPPTHDSADPDAPSAPAGPEGEEEFDSRETGSFCSVDDDAPAKK